MRLTPTHDLNSVQIINLANLLGKEKREKLECIIHQHLPIFHTEHCVFCKFLSDGNSFKDCGHPCESNHVALRDLNGQDHIVLADMGCRNTVFNSQAQSGAPFFGDFIDAGIKHFRIELVDESPRVVVELLEYYRKISLGDQNMVDSLWNWLEKLPNTNGLLQGVTSGSLLPIAEKRWESMKPTSRR